VNENRTILHADMDAFYASIEQRDNPELRGRPVIVGAAAARGVVAAASYEARKYGIHSAMPGFRARALCPHAVFLPSNMAHYSAVSAQIHDVFLSFTEQVEPLALDEAFLDITGSLRLFGGAESLATKLKRAVFDATALTVSVGLGPNKMVAKIACTLGKPNGLHVISKEQAEAFLEPLPIRRLWGVGPVLATRLADLGIRTLGDLKRFDQARLEAALGQRASELQSLARGIDRRQVEADRTPKSYGEENTFESDISERERVTAALTAHAEAVARRVRHDGYRGRTVTLRIKLGLSRGRRVSRGPEPESEPIYPLLTRSKTLSQPTDDGRVLREVAVRLWDEARISEPVRLLGISLSNLERVEQEQLELFRPKRDNRLGSTLDAIVERFGEKAISRAVDAPDKITPSSRRKRGER
jgi:DNA polymerase IV